MYLPKKKKKEFKRSYQTYLNLKIVFHCCVALIQRKKACVFFPDFKTSYIEQEVVKHSLTLLPLYTEEMYLTHKYFFVNIFSNNFHPKNKVIYRKIFFVSNSFIFQFTPQWLSYFLELFYKYRYRTYVCLRWIRML